MSRFPFAAALLLIVLFGAALRTYDLSTVPSELIVDELDLYNSAYSIATTGHDVDGKLFPFTYSKFTRNPPVYAVAGYVSSLIFGRTPFGLRLPAVFFGLASIVLIFYLTLELTGREEIALVAALIQAIAPIFIQFSRIAWEPSSELPFLLGGLYVLVRAFRRAAAGEAPSFKSLALAALLLGLTCYTYSAGWFYALVLGGAVVLLNIRRLHEAQAWPRVASAFGIWLLVAAPALWMLFFDPLTAGKTARLSTFAHGLNLESLRTFALNYLAHFRWSYLVTTGDPLDGITWRYLNGFGAFYGWIAALAIIGAVAVFRYATARWGAVWILIWLAAYPLGGSLTNEGGAPNAPRTLAGAPVFCVLAAVGFIYIADLAATIENKRLASIMAATTRWLLGLAAAISLALFASFYFTRYVHFNSNAWDSGTRTMFTAIRHYSTTYKRVCFGVRQSTYEAEPYILFYLHDVKILPIDTLGSFMCYLPGTIIVTDSNHMLLPMHFTVIDTIVDIDDHPFAVIVGRP